MEPIFSKSPAPPFFFTKEKVQVNANQKICVLRQAMLGLVPKKKLGTYNSERSEEGPKDHGPINWDASFATVDQQLDRLTHNQEVGGAIPPSGTYSFITLY